MASSQKPKADTPVMKTLTRNASKTITLDNIWSVLSDVNDKVTTYDSDFNNINIKLSNLESSFNDFKSSLNLISTELSKVKKDNEGLSSEIQLLRSRVIQLEHSQSHNVDVIQESHDRLLKEKNLIIFNVPDSDTEASSVTTSLVNEIFKDLPNPVSVSNAKRLGKPSNRPRPILIQFNSHSEVHSILRIKSKLRSSTRWKEVSISTDMTINQRNHMKLLCAQLKDKRDMGDLSWFIKYVAGIPKLVQKN